MEPDESSVNRRFGFTSALDELDSGTLEMSVEAPKACTASVPQITAAQPIAARAVARLDELLMMMPPCMDPVRFAWPRQLDRAIIACTTDVALRGPTTRAV